MTLQIATAVVVFITLVGVAIGRWPWLKMNRATIALVGATTLIAMGVIPLEEAFRAVDHDLVLLVARAAKEAGASTFVLVSSAGAELSAKPLYLRVKAETETAVTKLRFKRLDILRPGLLRGPRGDDRRPLERLGILASPIVDRFLRGGRRAFRSIDARLVAAAALQCARERAAGRFVHDNDAIRRAVRRLEEKG